MRSTQTYRFLTATCPHCQHRGKLRIARLDKTFTCNKCHKKFYLDISGSKPGDRPADIDPRAVEAAYSAPPAIHKPSKLERLWDLMPRASKLAIAGGVILACALGFYAVRTWAGSRPPIPLDIDARAQLAGEAIFEESTDPASPIVVPGTESKFKYWIEESRPATWSTYNPNNGAPKISAKKLYKSKTESGYLVTVVLPKVGAPAEQIVVMKVNALGEWCIDGDATYQRLGRTSK